MITSKPLLVLITGPTASGKTRLSVELAGYFQSEIISADSRQFYREMIIGTAVPAPEELSGVKHHFIHHLSVTDSYNVSKFETDTIDLLQQLYQHHNLVFLVGGSGLYIDAVSHGIDQLPDPDPDVRAGLKELLAENGIIALQNELKSVDPDYAAVVDAENPVRLIRALEIFRTTGIPYSALRKNVPRERSFRVLKVGITYPREILNQRINGRVDEMMDAGLLDEVAKLLPFRHLNALNAVGYRELFDYLDGKTSLSFAVEKIKTNSRRYAKRQMTWFGRDKEIQWFSPPDPELIRELIDRNL